MRFTLTEDEAKEILSLNLSTELYLKIENQLHQNQNRDISKKKVSTQKATQTKKQTAINKIENCVNLMRLENKKINVNSVSNESKVAYNTIKKYLPDLIYKK